MNHNLSKTLCARTITKSERERETIIEFMIMIVITIMIMSYHVLYIPWAVYARVHNVGRAPFFVVDVHNRIKNRTT